MPHTTPLRVSNRRQMRVSHRILLVVMVALGAAPAAAATFQGKVVGVADGDTITVRADGRTERVRLHGIDCPERGQAFGTRARRATSDLTLGKRVTVRARDRDDYGRLVGDVFLPDGRRLNDELVAGGLAWWYRRHSTDPVLQRLEAEARRARRGLWSDPSAVPPWEYRQRRRR